MFSHPIFLVFLGGGLGATARFGLGSWFRSLNWVDGFPWHTFLTNVVGSLLLGVLAVVCKDRPSWYLLLGVGGCGGFTTFSTFSLELLDLLEKNRLFAAVAYAVGSVLAGLLGAGIGMRYVGASQAVVVAFRG
jgi:fluoride exporter